MNNHPGQHSKPLAGFPALKAAHRMMVGGHTQHAADENLAAPQSLSLFGGNLDKSSRP